MPGQHAVMEPVPVKSPATAVSGARRRAQRLATPRLTRERRTIEAMLTLVCRADAHPKAADATLCADCAALLEYATRRLAACPYGPDKPTCTNCQIHCYGPQQRAQVREVMRRGGPRMLWHHPWLAIQHLLFDARRIAPPKPRAGATSTPPGTPAE